jgi:hypothetical protein
MPRRTRMLVTALALIGIATPAAASDCRLAPNYQLSFMRPASSLGERALPGGQERHQLPADRLRYAQREVGLGLNLGLSNPSGGSTINADGALAIGERMRAVAALGSCDPGVEGADNGIIFGGAFAMHFLGSVDSPWGIVGQLGVSRFSSGGASFLSVPVIVGAGWAVSERAVVYAGPMLSHERTSSGGSGYSYSDSTSRPCRRPGHRPEAADHPSPSSRR